MKLFFRILILFTILTTVLSSCSRKKNGFSRRAFHNTTSHYNYYFNARELIRVHEENIAAGESDDYNYLLPIYNYGTEADAKSAYENMDEVVKKCSRLIDRHSMYIKKEEYNKWIDESYLLVGKAKFYKQEYYGALEVYEYILIAYKGKPSFFESKLWMARCYMQMGDYREAYNIMESYKESTVPDEIKGEYFAVYADLDIKTDHKEEAALHLKQSIEFIKNKTLKRRYTYILAQLYHERKDYANATKYYGKVLKMRPDYVMAFNAKLNQARSYDPAAGNSEEIKKRLNRMLRDKKNIEYKDQIYFALAEMAFREGDQDAGMEYLRLSASSSVGNNKVKSEAYMLLGDIYYDKPDYLKSHSYYDSSLTIMPQGHPKFEKTEERKESLDDLVFNLRIIIEEDSLQMLARMDEKERDKLILAMIREVEREEELKKIELERGFAQSYELANKRGGQESVGQWYFYNQNSKSFGVSEFVKLWGERKLEDNWRRANKNTEVRFSSDEEKGVVTDTIDEGITNKDPEFYLNQLPLTDSSMGASHNRIILALYNAGNYFREDFMDYRYAIEEFERLVTQYDTCRYVASAYYQMYRIYLLTEEGDKAALYKQKILTEYPFSEYARIIKNPDYLKNKRDKNEQVEAYYRATYQLYDYKLYDDVIEASKKSDSLFGNHHLKPKFDFLRALAIGQSKSQHEFRIALEEVVAAHPSDEVSKAAQTILDKMSQKRKEKVKREALYKENFREEHIFVVMVPNSSAKVSETKLTISNYNVKSVGSSTLKITAVKFNAEYQMISVKSFDNRDKGKVYIQNITQYPEFKDVVIQNKYEHFIISSENYAYFYKEKELSDYMAFYKDHYLK